MSDKELNFNQHSAHDEAVVLMSSWISAIADQVKNPVAGISAAAGIIERQMAAFRASGAWDPEIVEEAVRLMQARLSTFDNYLSELSGFTRHVVLEIRRVDLSAIWPSIEQYLARKVPMNFSLKTAVAENIYIHVDLDRFKSSLAAVILNSVEACGSSKVPNISINVSAVKESAHMPSGVVVTVLDDGPGFSEIALKKGLVPFFTTKEAGTGLGLAMIDKFTRAHGGWLKIENQSSMESGASVQMFFPNHLVN